MEPSHQWREYHTPDGRAYYYHAPSQRTQWTKPHELMSAAERALADQPWKEYTAEGGRKYWYNFDNKTSTWEMPEVYKNALGQSSMPQKPPTPTQHFVAGGGSVFNPYQPPRDRDDAAAHDRNAGDRGYMQQDSLRASFLPAVSHEPDYSSLEEAEAAFMKLLKRAGVQLDWTWEQAMRATIKDPQYRALKDPKDRKAAFEKFVVEARAQDKERAQERLEKLREDFGKMLKSHPEIKHYTRWKTARPIIEGETIFRSTNNDTERRQLFEEYKSDLKKAHANREAANRSAVMDDLTSILNALNLEPYTRWSDARRIIYSNERFQADDKFRSLAKSDVLTAFEDHVKSLERAFNESLQLKKSQKLRRERQNRDGFVALLKELKSADKIKAGTKWMTIYPLIKDDPRYVSMLGQTGSTPLDLFWDMVEEAEAELRVKRNEVLDVLDDVRFEIVPEATFEEFMDVMGRDTRTSSMDSDDLKLIFSRLRDKVILRREEDRENAERAQRHAVDALRSRIKHLQPPVRATDTWEHDVRPRVERCEEYQALESDELRKSAFEKFVRRQKEKEAEAEHVERARRGGARERDRDRDRRANGPRRDRREHSRSPEPDAYEADRKKAIADRERQYRKSSTTGLSPPPPEMPRRRDGRDAYDIHNRDRYERSGRPGGGPGFDRERRDREERERPHTARGGPRDAGGARELDYGESGRAGSMAGATRRRRESEDDDARERDGKRARRDHGSRTPVEPAPPKEEERALRSGSEEGEIEED